jgi:NAD(P)-dependent dehydrogenase (short-subunit alcohol dehydrogenase family)
MATILITGANRGIGYAMTEALLKRGDRVIATVRDPFHVPDLLKTAPRDQMILLGMEVTDQRSVDRAAASVKEPIDILINNAGVLGQLSESTLDMDLNSFMQTMQVNTLGPMRVSLAFLPHLKRSENARILTISTQMASLTYAQASNSDRMAYRASKAALNKIMQGMASDFVKEGVSVALVHPGWVKTDMGGEQADITPQESATGILALLDKLTMKDTGHFFRWDGTTHPW